MHDPSKVLKAGIKRAEEQVRSLKPSNVVERQANEALQTAAQKLRIVMGEQQGQHADSNCGSHIQSLE